MEDLQPTKRSGRLDERRSGGVRFVGIFVPWQAVAFTLTVVVVLTALVSRGGSDPDTVRVEQTASEAPAGQDSTTSTIAPSTTSSTTPAAVPVSTSTTASPISVPSSSSSSTTTTTRPVSTTTTTTVVAGPASTTTTTVPCTASAAGGVANLRATRIGREGAELEWDCYPGFDPHQYYYDGAYVTARKGGTYTDWTAPLKIYSGTKSMPMALEPDTEYSFRVAPLQNGQPGVWEEITIRTLSY